MPGPGSGQQKGRIRVADAALEFSPGSGRKLAYWYSTETSKVPE